MSGPAVILIGPMGAGKTSVGRRLAQRLRVPFTDLDAKIVEQAEWRSIPEIFRAEGEESFRRREAEALAAELRTGQGVLALGGGAPLTPSSFALLQEAPVALLEVEASAVGARLRRGRRPLLEGEDPLQRWQEITAERLPRYRILARWSIDTTHGSADHHARRLAELIGGTEPSTDRSTTQRRSTNP